MELIDKSKSILENAYFVSGILILVTVVVGIVQVILAKRTLKINSRREAAKLAAEQIEIYMIRVIPLHNKLFYAEAEHKVKSVKLNVSEFTIKALIEAMGEESYKAAVKDRIKLVTYTLNVINSMEAFSVYFTKGVADEEIAFSAVGQTFVKSVESMYFDIASCINDSDDKSFQNLVQLYKLWSERFKKGKLLKDYKSLEEQLRSIEDVTIGPIGTRG
jgi:hypothetical protein